MTQQSLITRLRLYEKALEELDTLARNFSVSGVYFSEFKENVSALNESDSALSDLRELIKEAEGQAVPDVNWLANVIRSADGTHSIGAGALAEKIVDAMLAAAPQPPASKSVPRPREVKRTSDMSVQVVFNSCHEASTFEEMLSPKEIGE